MIELNVKKNYHMYKLFTNTIVTIVIIFLNKIDGYLISEGNNASSNIGRFGIESDEKICETAWKQVVDKLA